MRTVQEKEGRSFPLLPNLVISNGDDGDDDDGDDDDDDRHVGSVRYGQSALTKT